jgi:DNA-binding transcriptional LysR family regulator
MKTDINIVRARLQGEAPVLRRLSRGDFDVAPAHGPEADDLGRRALAHPRGIPVFCASSLWAAKHRNDQAAKAPGAEKRAEYRFAWTPGQRHAAGRAVPWLLASKFRP